MVATREGRWVVDGVARVGMHTHTHTHERNNSGGTIALLDIFGFESFERNHFDQLLINYANETLQQRFCTVCTYTHMHIE